MIDEDKKLPYAVVIMARWHSQDIADCLCESKSKTQAERAEHNWIRSLDLGGEMMCIAFSTCCACGASRPLAETHKVMSHRIKIQLKLTEDN